ncbi:MAG TPA: chloride channel protein [Gemmatimonadales bacterium]|nr:chloride channel protein [Gemmatimonadales bacterium]
MILIAGLAGFIGLLGAVLSVVLLRLIAFFTNLFFYQRLSIADASPADHHLGPAVIIVPVVGALIVGLMARFGSERIRGHGIPEAIETILMRGSRAEPKLVVLKPLSAAISIGSGGPFGAEGPIIMTAGSLGSMIAQFFHLTDVERKTLLVAGAAAGMSATFASPVAATLLAVELLLFEWKPRSLVPVAIASLAAFAARHVLLGPGPIFPVAAHPPYVGLAGLAGSFLVGLLAGFAAWLLTTMVYWSEDTFARLPIHWMWWPAIGGLVIGIGGWIFPKAMGVGYETIGALLQGRETLTLVAGILIVKSVIWAVSLGSGTSGGVLAPLLMIGGALGGLSAHVLPAEGPGFWPLICMAAMLGGTMRAPFTAAVFGLELTHDLNVLAPLFLAAVAAHAVTVLALPRSILTEKVARRGFHLSREYTVDPLEILLVNDVMDTAMTETMPVPTIAISARAPLRVAVYRMAETGTNTLAVFQPESEGVVVGILKLDHLLQARVASLAAESRRERHLQIWMPWGDGTAAR